MEKIKCEHEISIITRERIGTFSFCRKCMETSTKRLSLKEKEEIKFSLELIQEQKRRQKSIQN